MRNLVQVSQVHKNSLKISSRSITNVHPEARGLLTKSTSESPSEVSNLSDSGDPS
jgi:hypothetical protein